MLKNFIKRKIHSESGLALNLVLVVLVFGGILIAPAINFASTNLNSVRHSERNTKGVYAAEAGVEYVIWCVENNVTPPAQLTANVNGLAVNLSVENSGDYTLYLGQLVQTNEHWQYVDVASEIVWDEPANAYRFTITITWHPGEGEPRIFLEEVGARLPPGYGYKDDSAAGFDNLALIDPNPQVDSQGANMVNWVFGPVYPSVSSSNPEELQSFYITGTGNLEGEYAWVGARREDVGQVGEISGGLYRITATAIAPESGEIITQLKSDVMISNSVDVISWQFVQ